MLLVPLTFRKQSGCDINLAWEVSLKDLLWKIISPIRTIVMILLWYLAQRMRLEQFRRKALINMLKLDPWSTLFISLVGMIRRTWIYPLIRVVLVILSRKLLRAVNLLSVKVNRRIIMQMAKRGRQIKLLGSLVLMLTRIRILAHGKTWRILMFVATRVICPSFLIRVTIILIIIIGIMIIRIRNLACARKVSRIPFAGELTLALVQRTLRIIFILIKVFRLNRMEVIHKRRLLYRNKILVLALLIRITRRFGRR